MGRLDQSLQVMDRRLLLRAGEIAEIFNVPLGAANGRVRQAKDGKVTFLCVLQKVLEHLQMHGGIAHDALFADLFPSCLELRLDEADSVAVRLQKPRERGQNELERDERHVHRCEIQLIGDLLVREIARVRALHTHHALVTAEPPVELTAMIK